MLINEEEMDALQEIVNIGVGRAAGSLSELIGSRINLRVPALSLVSPSDCDPNCGKGMSIVQGFDGSVSGNALLVFPIESGQTLARLLGGYDEDETIPEFEISGILSEIGNIVLNGVLGSLANAIETDLLYQVPDFFVNESFVSLVEKGTVAAEDSVTPVLLADTQFSVEDSDIEGSIMIAFRLGSLEKLIEELQQLFV